VGVWPHFISHYGHNERAQYNKKTEREENEEEEEK